MSWQHDSTASLSLTTPVQYLPGVGPQRARLMEKLGLRICRDFLYFFPRDYQDMSSVCSIAQLRPGQSVTLVAEVTEVDERKISNGRRLFGVLVTDGTGYLRAIWYNAPYMAKRFRVGQQVVLSGTPKLRGLRWELTHPHVRTIDLDAESQGEIVPVYSLTEGIKQSNLRRAVRQVLDLHLKDVDEVIPESLRASHDLDSIQTALAEIHFPTSRESLARARHRFVFQELLVLQLALAMRRHQRITQHESPAMETTARIDARIRRLFSFSFTVEQERAIHEVSNDLAKNVPMLRLLQGDVGSGKTVVAIYAMLVAVAHGYQAALMVPSEVLAQQHYQVLQQALARAHVRMGLLSGGVTAAQRRTLNDQIAAGEIDLVIGTQALLYGELQFPRLALVVIDEQHKFGVLQRARLRQTGGEPHYLVMTATPIPRTIAMTTFGDLDVSTLREGPPNRQQVHSYLAEEEKRDAWWQFVRRKLREGRQAYVIVPVVEEQSMEESTDSISPERAPQSLEAFGADSGSNMAIRTTPMSLRSAYESLAHGELESFRIDLIHGGMSSTDKQQTMQRFREGETQVLVSTSVVEVGVDVPNATIMTIENGERFGLAQLHQLRGRIRRGAHPGYVCVFARAETEDAQQRLEAFVSTSDGFALSELDFKLRGAGDLLGTRQHGLPPLRIADLTRDEVELEAASQVARSLIAEDPDLQDPVVSGLRRQVLVRYGHALELSDVG